MRIQSTLLLAGLAACGGDELFTPELGATDRLLAQHATTRLQIDDEALGADAMNGVVVLGDIDGDGIDDAVVQTAYDTATEQLTSTYVLYGGSAPAGTVALGDLPALTAGSYAIPAVTALGDVNGDGLADFMIGGLSTVNAGARLVYGSRNRFVGAQPLADVGVVLQGADAGTGWQQGIGLGDLDGDGLADFAIPTGDQILVFYGRTQQLSGTLDPVATADAKIEGGSAVGLGDIDGDGYADLVVTAPDLMPQAWIVRGSATRLTGTQTLAAVGSTELSTGYLTYQNAVALGDLDGDGRADFVLSTYDADRHQHRKLLYYGRAGGFGATLAPGSADAVIYSEGEIPGAIAAADLDGDGHKELLIGDSEARDLNGAVRIFAGGAQRLSGEIDPDVPTLSYVGAPSHATHCQYALGEGCIVHEYVGRSIAIGDLTGDHHPDVLIGAPTDIFFAHKGVHGTSAGHVYLLEP